jgi:translation initiation factor 2B subunit (eIF-2B alpha/beta/delta family)
LEVRLEVLALDRDASAESLAHEMLSVVRLWVRESTLRLWSEVGLALERGLAPFDEQQGWRGPCGHAIDALRRAWRAGLEVEQRADALQAFAHACDEWAEARTPSKVRVLASYATRTLEIGETILVHGHGEAMARSLEAAHSAGRAPRILIARAAPDDAHERFARRLASHGISTTVLIDGFMCGAVADVDRVWLSSEALGADTFAARAGARSILLEAEREDVPFALLATSDHLVPGGHVRLPPVDGRVQENPFLRFEAQMFEAVPHELVPYIVTEMGHERLSDLCVRALQTRRPPPCISIEDFERLRQAGPRH